MRPRIGALLLALATAGCAVPPPAPANQAAPAPVVTAPPPQSPPLRTDLQRRWLLPSGKPRYPAHDGFSGAPVLVVLPADVLLDRFGSEHGNFFSPKGAPHSARALPSVCGAAYYATYRVRAPLPVWAGAAVPWFGEPGGATQFKTDAPAAMLLADGTIERVPHQGAAPCN